jgi:hypothetical protein
MWLETWRPFFSLDVRYCYGRAKLMISALVNGRFLSDFLMGSRIDDTFNIFNLLFADDTLIFFVGQI